ncbi:MAG: hypothetical protein M3475_06745 [Actinomycetota bacterium]|nr:hypothetical protein [Actinomycetota bacterium]
MSRRNRLFLLFLLPGLFFLLGFTPGKQTSEQEAVETARYVPQVDELLSKPTVDVSARYSPDLDLWRVSLKEQVSGSTVARMVVKDDSGRVTSVEISPNANGIEYPKLSEADAIKLSTADERVRDRLSQHNGYSTDAEYKDEAWTVHYRVNEEGAAGGIPNDNGTKEIARVEVDDESWELEYIHVGDQVGWQMARGESGAYGKQANYFYVWLPLALVFFLAFVQTDKLYSLRNLDLLVLLGFLVSHGFFRAGESYAAVLLWYPPLIYLLVRTLLMGFGIGERVEKTSNFPTWLLFVLGILASALVIGLNLDARVIDVGYAGVVGADRIIDGSMPYGNFPDDVGTGDTYGPLNYLIYVPFVLIFGFSGEWGYLPAAHGATILAFLAGCVAMLLAGWRFSGPRGGAAMFFAWSVFPYTLYSTNNNTNDVIVAAIAAIGLAAAASPIGRGAVIAAGFATKLYPLVLGPLWLLHEDRRKAPIIDFFLGGAAILLMSFWILALDGTPLESAKLFYDKSIAFQGDRETPWTIYTQLPWTEILQLPLQILLFFIAVSVALIPQRRTVRRLAAFSAALVIGFQLTVNYWFYPYVTWFEPFVFLALLTATNEKTALDGDDQRATNDGPLAAIGSRILGRWLKRD